MSPRLRRPLFTHSLLVFCIGLHLVSLQNSLWPFAADNDEVTVLAYSRVRELCHLESWFPSPRPPTISSQRLKQLWDSHHYTVPPPPNSDQNAPQVPQGRDLTYETSQVKLSLHVFAWKRAKSLNRLLTSLLKADYSSQSFVDMFIHIDGRPTDAVLEVIDGFSWPFGELIMKRNTRNIGLKKMILNAWSDDDPATHTLFFEDDISVSPLFFEYSFQCARLFLTNDAVNAQILGCSLYTPRLDEISPTADPQHPPLWNPSLLVEPSIRWVLYQLPCSWGAVYERKKWMEFTRYFEYRLSHLESVPPVPLSRSNNWQQSWKRFLIEFMYAKGLVLVYPNFPNQKSFSTNHYEEGMHSVPEGMEAHVPDVLREAQDERFLVPLLDMKDAVAVSSSFPKTFNERIRLNEGGRSLPWISLHNRLVQGSTDLMRQGRDWLLGVKMTDMDGYKLLASDVENA